MEKIVKQKEPWNQNEIPFSYIVLTRFYANFGPFLSIQVHELLLYSTAWHLSERVESLRSKASWEVISQWGYDTGEHSEEADFPSLHGD